MKKYQIIKNKNNYSIASKQDIKDFYKCYFLPYILKSKRKKDLIYTLENDPIYKQYKNDTDYKTIKIY